MEQPTDRQSLEDQMEEDGRLPPGQSLTKKFSASFPKQRSSWISTA